MKRLIFLALGIVLLLIGREAIAQNEPNLNRLLRGKYAFTQIASCVQNINGFDEIDNFRLLSGAATFTFAQRQILNYNGDGTGSLTDGESLSITHDAVASGAFPVSHSDVTCDLSYVVNPDRSFTQTLSNCTSTFLPGNLAGTTQTVSPFQMQGHIGPGRRTLVISDTSPNVETVFRTPPSPGLPFTRERICLRSGTAIKIWEFGDRDD
jgi:hypothetical protein